MIETTPYPTEWTDQWQLFYHFYGAIYQRWKHSQGNSKQFCLAAPLDIHRDFLDMVIVFANAIYAVPLRNIAVTAVFPTLLQVLTLRAFRFAPIFHYSYNSIQPQIKIDVAHVTRKSLKHMKDAMILQRKNLTALTQNGQFCSAAHVFLKLAETSYPFIVSTACDRSVVCFKSIIEVIPHLLKEHTNRKHTCEKCDYISKMPKFLWACSTILQKFADAKPMLLKAAISYEPWLEKGAMKIVKETWDLPVTPRSDRVYRYL